MSETMEQALSDWFNNLPDGGLGKEHFDALLSIVRAVRPVEVMREAVLEEAAKVAERFTCGTCGMDGKVAAAIRALKTAPISATGKSEQRGMVLVPREPTAAMLDAAWRAPEVSLSFQQSHGWRAVALGAYRAMIAAAGASQ